MDGMISRGWSASFALLLAAPCPPADGRLAGDLADGSTPHVSTRQIWNFVQPLPFLTSALVSSALYGSFRILGRPGEFNVWLKAVLSHILALTSIFCEVLGRAPATAPSCVYCRLGIRTGRPASVRSGGTGRSSIFPKAL